MGLGEIILNADKLPSFSRGTCSNPGITATSSMPPASEETATATTSAPEFVILVPALGFPALVGSDGIFTVLLLSKQSVGDAKTKIYLTATNGLRWQAFDEVVANFKGSRIQSTVIPQAGNFPGSFVCGNELSLKEYRRKIESHGFYTWKRADILGLHICYHSSTESGGFATFGDIHGQISPGLLNLYEKEGYTTLVTLELKLNEEHRKKPGLFALRCAGEDEKVRTLLKNLKPYEGCPIDEMNGATKTFARRAWCTSGWTEDPGGEDVIMLHPVSVGISNSGFLNVAHMTDLHIARRWDFMQAWTADPKGHPSGDELRLYDELNNPNRNYEAVLEQIANLIKKNKSLVEQIAELIEENKEKNREKIAELQSELDVQALIQTGDLIEYCRGYNGTGPGNYNDSTFEYSTNWTLYYQLLAGNYHLPTFTVLGNHDWRMNPYAPSPTLQLWPNFGLVSLALVALGVAGLGPGLVLWALHEDAGEPTCWADKFFARPIAAWLVSIITLWLSVTGLLALVNLYITPVGPSFPGIFALVFVLGGLVLGYGAAMFSLALPSNETQILSGLAAGGSIWAIFLLVLFANEIWKFLGLKYLTEMVDQEEETVKKFFPNNFQELDLFGDNSLFAIKDESFLWYSLVINPFTDYAFQYGRTHLAFLDWNGSEGLENPPIAIDAISRKQFGLLTAWAEKAKNTAKKIEHEVRPILSSHFPIFSQDLDKKMKELKEGLDVHDDDLERGILEDRRDELLKLLEGMGKHKAPALTLGGHTHAYGVFQKRGSKVKLIPSKTVGDSGDNEVDLHENGFNQSEPTYVVTVCSGPPGDKGDGTGKRKPGYRRVYFDSNGTIKKMTEADAPGSRKL